MNRIPQLMLGLAAALSVSAAMAQVPAPQEGGPGANVRPAMRSLTRAEVLDMAARRFDAADTNKDGILTPEEQQAARSRPMPMPMPQHNGELKGPPPPPEGGPGPRPVR